MNCEERKQIKIFNGEGYLDNGLTWGWSYEPKDIVAYKIVEEEDVSLSYMTESKLLQFDPEDESKYFAQEVSEGDKIIIITKEDSDLTISTGIMEKDRVNLVKSETIDIKGYDIQDDIQLSRLVFFQYTAMSDEYARGLNKGKEYPHDVNMIEIKKALNPLRLYADCSIDIPYGFKRTKDSVPNGLHINLWIFPHGDNGEKKEVVFEVISIDESNKKISEISSSRLNFEEESYKDKTYNRNFGTYFAF